MSDADNTLIIHEKKYEVRNMEINQRLLKFYPENPRVYSILNVNDSLPDQETIEEEMKKLDHVKQLKESIKANGGLIDPLIVKDEEYIVFEGNSRLAAYRMLCEEDPVKWGMVKCKILPKDIPESAVFQLLGQYHIIGRKDWSPFEQAGYLYRRIKKAKQTVDSIARELGITKNSAIFSIGVYEKMLENDDVDPKKWSFYEELLKNKSIRESLDNVYGLDDAIYSAIKENKIRAALDIRNCLGGIAKVHDKEAKRVMKKIAEGDIDIYEGYQIVEEDGKTGNIYQTLKKFRSKINDSDFEEKMLKEDKDNIKFELNKIQKTVKQLLRSIENQS